MVEKIRGIKVVKVIGSGMTSICYLLQNDIVAKQYVMEYITKNQRGSRLHLKKELHALKVLKNYPNFPKLHEYDNKNKTLFLSYCGEKVRRENLPVKWEEQAIDIMKCLTRLNLHHNDIFCKNICTRLGRLYLVDFGLSGPKRYNNNDMVKAIRNEVIA